MRRSSRGNAFRRYPGLAFILAAAALAVLLPTALNVPQSGPSTLAEFAPVPGKGQGASDLSDLGAASSGGLGLGSAGGRSVDVPAPLGGPEQSRSRLKRCVGKPPRQTEDPMSPPCVAFFQGNNGGATYQGVTKDQITVLVYMDPATYNVGDQVDQSPAGGQYCDVGLAANTGGPGCYSRGTEFDHKLVQMTRAFSRVFNDRYQTYGRSVRYWIYWGMVSNATAAQKRGYAEGNYERLKPFAVIDETFLSGNDEAYADAMAERGVLIFPGFESGALSGTFFRKYAPHVWAFFPDIEHWAQNYVSYVCQKVAPLRVSHTEDGRFQDGSAMQGKPRRFGFLYSNDTSFPGLQVFSDLVRDGIAKCGIQPVEEAAIIDKAGPGQDGSAAVAVTRMRGADASTLLFAGASTLTFSQASDTSKYYPEIVIAGDGEIDRNLSGRIRNQNFMKSAWVVSNQLGYYSLDEDYGYLTCREGDSNLSRAACEFAATRYRGHFMLFRTIQAAGPRLTSDTIDRGMHAIPRLSSDHHSKAACFFDPGDFTCVKDSIEEWWHPTDRPPGKTTPGCWKMTLGGQRFLPGQWPSGDHLFSNTNAPCNSFTLGGAYDQ